MSVDLSLYRLDQISGLSSLPPYTRPTCHIAGTNGKGSVSALLSTILQSSSPPLKVGRYNSPHLLSIYDCITINNIPVSRASYRVASSRVTESRLQEGTKLSSFEIMTLTALKVFERKSVDIAIVEAGMGRRLDITNIMQDYAILVSVLTTVDLEEKFYSDDTVGKIASEKAGMARGKKPFVLGSQNPAHAQQIEASVKKVVDGVGAVLVPAITVLKRDWDATVDGPPPESFSLLSSSSQSPPPQPVEISLPCFSSPLKALLPLYGAHQLDNLGTALTVINTLLTDPLLSERVLVPHSYRNHRLPPLKNMITPESVARGIKETKWPGRLSFHTVHLPPSPSTPNEAPPPPFLVLADAAHNPTSAKSLGDYITHLLHQTIVSFKEVPNYHARRRNPICINLNITYILSLSQYPPKPPLQTLSPLFPLGIPELDPGDIAVSTTISVALLRFTSPEGMPRIKSVPPTKIKVIIKGLIPDADVWVVPDADADDVDSDAKVENGPKEKSESEMEKALRWAAGKRKENEDGDGEDRVEQANLVVLAGSLFLVADFYRFLNQLIL